MPVYQIDPLTDPRWGQFTQYHPRASIFHSVGWLRALQMSYGYEPVAYTLSLPNAELSNAVVFSRIHSWATGRRLVSLPFADHCEPLADVDADASEILEQVCWEATRQRYRFVEVRAPHCVLKPAQSENRFDISNSFILHRLDLEPTLDQLFRNCHKDCLQRKIRRAEREKLECREGRSEDLLRMFFSLLIKTRRKHRIPPQPIEWFRHLICHLNEHLNIQVALKGELPVAAIMTLRWKNTLVYKYGCSDPEFSNLGGTPMVFWKAIQKAKSNQLRWFDLGRSDTDNMGLLTFKDHWGATRCRLEYVRCPAPKTNSTSDWKRRLRGLLLNRMPDSLLAMTGRLLYKHIG